MTVKILARVLLTLGFLAASVGYSSWTAQRTVLDPAATRGATQTLLATPAVQTMLAREIRTSLRPALGGVAAANPKLTAAINAAVADPKFIGAFENAIMNLHESVLSGGNGPVTLDTRAVTKAINDAVARVDPQAAPKVRTVHTVSVPIGASNLPHIGNVGHEVSVVESAAIALAVALIGGALLLAHDRKTFRRVGRRTAFLALPPVLVFLVLPHLLNSAHNSGMVVAGAVLQAYGHRVMFSAAALAVIGISTWLIAIALPGRVAHAAPDAGLPVPAAYMRPPDPRIPIGDPAAAVLPERLYL